MPASQQELAETIQRALRVSESEAARLLAEARERLDELELNSDRVKLESSFRDASRTLQDRNHGPTHITQLKRVFNDLG